MTLATAASTLVCCIGNDLVADDGVACRVFERLQALELPGSPRVEQVGVGGLDLLELLTGAEGSLVVVDAVQFGAPPGTVHCLDWQDLPAARGMAVSAHAIGLRETVEVGKVVCPDKLPSRIVLVGIEGRRFDELGGAMTPETAAAVDTAARRVRDLLFTFEQEAEVDE